LVDGFDVGVAVDVGGVTVGTTGELDGVGVALGEGFVAWGNWLNPYHNAATNTTITTTAATK